LVGQHKLPSGAKFHAAGVSLVLHPWNPHVPTIHMNVRYFECGNVWWFGGGIDVTPYYPVPEQIVAFHQHLKRICETHQQPYEQYKLQCDDYFTLPHRGEMRGIGGIFFDNLTTPNKKAALDFIIALGSAFKGLYEPFIDANSSKSYGTRHRDYQLVRRGRYTEFNLLYDRGTKFGLQSNGRTESILMSLPAVALWKYNWRPPMGSYEEMVNAFYLQPQDWASMSLPLPNDPALRMLPPSGDAPAFPNLPSPTIRLQPFLPYLNGLAMLSVGAIIGYFVGRNRSPS
jgi:coproporphyrinogen III oxidase